MSDFFVVADMCMFLGVRKLKTKYCLDNWNQSVTVYCLFMVQKVHYINQLSYISKMYM